MKFNLKSIVILLITVFVIVFIRKNKRPASDWHKHSLIGFHTHIEVTWLQREKGSADLKKKIDSLVTWFDEIFTETNLHHPLNVLSRNIKNTPVVLTGEIKKVFDFLTELKHENKNFSQFKLASAEWLLKLNLLDGNSPESLYSNDSLRRILQAEHYNYNSESGELYLMYDSLHLTLGSVSKGYGINKLTELMLMNRIRNFLINAGGDLSYLGTNREGGPWRIGVQHPRRPDTILTVITPWNAGFKGLATSGDYENFRIEEDKRIHHLIDATTGFSISNKQSVSVLAGDPMKADYYATFLFLLPIDTLLNYVNNHTYLEVMVTDSLGRQHFSRGMKKYLQGAIGNQ